MDQGRPPPVIMLSIHFAAMVREWLDERRGALDLAFEKRTGRPKIKAALRVGQQKHEGTPISGPTLYRCFKKKVPGGPGNLFFPHFGRHFFACMFILRGTSYDARLRGMTLAGMGADWVHDRGNFWLKIVQRQLGHLSEQTTEIYLRWLVTSSQFAEIAAGCIPSWTVRCHLMANKRLVRVQLHREIDGQPTGMRSWDQPGRDQEPHIVNLRHFYEGGRGADLEPRYRRNWGGDFRARPSLADEFRALIENSRPTKDEFDSNVSAWRLLHRFLDEHPAPVDVQTIADLYDIHGALLKSWLQARGIKHPTTYKRIKTIVDRMRDIAGLPDLLWPARDPDRLNHVDAVDEHGVVRLFSALKAEARCIKQMFREGVRLAGLVQLDKAESTSASSPVPKWTDIRASIMRKLATGPIPHRFEFKRDDWMVGPTYLAPTMSSRKRDGLFGALRWFHPSRRDTAVFLWLFMIGTGWNLSTVLSIDISDEKLWCEKHPHKAGYVVMHAFKGRPKKHVFGISMTKPEFHPYAIMKFMIAQTEGLRQTLRRDLADARATYASAPSYELKKQIKQLERWIKSPWLYHSANEPASLRIYQ